MKRNKTLRALLVGAWILAAGLSAGAATITLEPGAPVVTVGQVFQVTLVGRDFTQGAGGTFGGGVTISWDPSLVSMNSFDTSVFQGDQLLATSNTNTVLNNGAGTLTDLSVASFFDGVEAADFDIAVLSFTALAPGVSPVNLSIGHFTSGFENIWTDSDPFNPIALDPDFAGGGITVVPEPTTGLMLAVGLIALGLARKRA